MTQAQGHMANRDAFSWYMERDPGLRSTIVTVLGLDRAPDVAKLTARIRRLVADLPQFRQRVVEPPLRLDTPRWTIDDDFDLTWHLRWESLPSWDEVLELARRDAMTAFDVAHPLWKATIVDGLPDGRAAVVMKLHHALTDGVGGMELALLLFDSRRRVRIDPPVDLPADGEHPTKPELVQEALADDAARFLHTASRVVRSAPAAALQAVRAPRQAVTDLAGLASSVVRTIRPVSRPGSPVMLERHLGRRLATLEVPLADLRRAGAAANGTLNDAFMAGVAGGIRRYHDRHGAPTRNLWVTVPINLRTAEDPLGGNRITLQRIELPADDTDVIAQMRAVHEACQRARREPAVPHTDAIAGSLNLLPAAYVGSMLKHVDVVASNVPGFPEAVHLAGAELVSYHAFGPTIGAALNVTLLSYRGTCFLGITIDTAAAPDSEALVACLREGFDEVLAVAPPPRSRRSPAVSRARAAATP
jgi:diacylglycerol O-acyltransferase